MVTNARQKTIRLKAYACKQDHKTQTEDLISIDYIYKRPVRVATFHLQLLTALITPIRCPVSQRVQIHLMKVLKKSFWWLGKWKRKKRPKGAFFTNPSGTRAMPRFKSLKEAVEKHFRRRLWKLCGDQSSIREKEWLRECLIILAMHFFSSRLYFCSPLMEN